LVASDQRDVVIESRPWGKFERYTLNEPCTVKLVYVEEGKRLSLQYHNNRTEFWKVVKGPVMVRVKDEEKIVMTGGTVTIPKKTVHRLIGLEGVRQGIIMEISFGQFDEADIVRLEDDYKRVAEAATS
jgi:mannose-6-phosphate isomerase-like protein (cupin superfamily)